MYYCKRCRNPVSAGSPFCLNCGTPVEVETEQTAGAAPAAAPTSTLTENATVATVKKYLHFIVVGLAALAFIMSILNLYGLYEVTAVGSGYGQRQTTSFPLRELYEEKPLLPISNILYGLVSMVIALIGVAHFLKTTMNNDLYDKFIGKIATPKLQKFVDGDGVLTLMGVLGAANVIFQWFLYLFTRESNWGVSAWIRIHWTSWVMLFVYLAAAGCDIFLLSKKKK